MGDLSLKYVPLWQETNTTKWNTKKFMRFFSSATGTTRKIIDTIARGCDVNEIERHDLLLKKQNDTYIPENEIAIFGMPVYAGRIPAISARIAATLYRETHSGYYCLYIRKPGL